MLTKKEEIIAQVEEELRAERETERERRRIRRQRQALSRGMRPSRKEFRKRSREEILAKRTLNLKDWVLSLRMSQEVSKAKKDGTYSEKGEEGDNS